MSLSRDWFDLQEVATKVYEGRRYHGKVKEYKINDILRISRYREETKKEEMFSVVIVDILHFPTFEQALTRLPINQVLPGIETVAEGVKVYERYVKLETQLRDGVHAETQSPQSGLL